MLKHTDGLAVALEAGRRVVHYCRCRLAGDRVGIRSGVTHQGRGQPGRRLSYLFIFVKPGEQIVECDAGRQTAKYCMHDHALQDVVRKIEEERNWGVLQTGRTMTLKLVTQIGTELEQALAELGMFVRMPAERCGRGADERPNVPASTR